MVTVMPTVVLLGMAALAGRGGDKILVVDLLGY
jgi:hypothetical protein